MYIVHVHLLLDKGKRCCLQGRRTAAAKSALTDFGLQPCSRT